VVQNARKLYYPIARHASVLFFIVQKLSQVDVMYQYSLSWFIQLFTSSVSNSKYEAKPDAQQHRPSSPHEERVDQLIDFFTFSLYSNVCRSIFEKDKLLFSFLLTAQIRLLQGKLTSVQYQLLISNMSGLDNPTKQHNPCPDWLPQQTWNKLCLC
jgi:dynein heavy chain